MSLNMGALQTYFSKKYQETNASMTDNEQNNRIENDGRQKGHSFIEAVIGWLESSVPFSVFQRD